MESGKLGALIHALTRSRICPSCLFEELISVDLLFNLCDSVYSLLSVEPLLLRLPAPITIVGDIHGNIDDLLRIFEVVGYPPHARYLFLGDYVDRGRFSIEVLTLLFALKCKFPNHISLLRGNHETLTISSCYGFSQECDQRFLSLLFTEFNTVFTVLPIAAIVGRALFCVHGGLSPGLTKIEELDKISKPADVPTGVLSDLMWSDPSPAADRFEPGTRGLGQLFGERAAMEFLRANRLQMIIRSHEACMEGMEWPFGDNHRSVLTVFSTTDYCGGGNAGVVIRVSEDLVLGKVGFVPLSEEARRKRRIIFPDWMLDHKTMVGSPESDHESQPEDPIWDTGGATLR
jgi:protein phosphatase